MSTSISSGVGGLPSFTAFYFSYANQFSLYLLILEYLIQILYACKVCKSTLASQNVM